MQKIMVNLQSQL